MRSARHVLVVEDDPDIAELISRRLRSLGLCSSHVSTGEAAILVVRGDPPALVLLDLLLPGINGWDVVDAIRSDPSTAGIPVVVTTMLDRDGLEHLDVQGFLVKPFRALDLERAIARVLTPPEVPA